MNRPQFLTTLVLSCLVVVFLLLQVVFSIQSQRAQLRVAYAQQIISNGRVYAQRWNQLAGRVYQLSQQQQDQGLKDLLTRQGISVTSNPPPENPAPPATGPANPAFH